MTRQTLSETAYQLIKKDILTCTLAPGQQIPQTDLVYKYKLGATPIREAIQRLSQDRLVQYLPQIGYMVSQIMIDDIRAIYELRALQESAAAHWACLRASQQELERIRDIADFGYVFGDEKSLQNYIARDKKFHLSLAAASQNQRLENIISTLLDESQRIILLAVRNKDMSKERRDEHVSLAEALCKRDTYQAVNIIENQIAHSQQEVVQVLNTMATLPPTNWRRQLGLNLRAF